MVDEDGPFGFGVLPRLLRDPEDILPEDGDGVTARDLTRRGHSYRNFDPGEFLQALRTEIDEQGDFDGRETVRTTLNFVESGRFADFLEATSRFYGNLDRDERDTFTRRNPDTTQWMGVWNTIEDLNPYPEMQQLAASVLTRNRSQAQLDKVPDWRRRAPRRTPLIDDLGERRRSYRNFTPQDFREVWMDAAGDHTQEALVRNLWKRIESNRFRPVLRFGHKFFTPLDPDERRSWARRNPGLIEWISVWAMTEHLANAEEIPDVSPEDLFFSFTEDFPYPFLDTLPPGAEP